MREIKFRGKRVDNGEWVYGHYYEYNFKSFICFQDHSDNATTDETHEVIPESVGQFTGLKDKNGVDIYEGDKIGFIDAVNNASESGDDWEDVWSEGEVLWCNETHRWDVTGRQTIDVEDIEFDQSLIIGNIHDKTPNNGK